MKEPTILEQIILASIYSLDDAAYGVAIRKRVQSLTGKNLMYGTLYNALDQLRRIVTDYVSAEYLVRRRVAEYFHQAARLAHRDGLARALVVEHRFLHRDALAPRLVLPQPEASHLRLAVNRRGHQGRVHRTAVRGLPRHMLHRHLTLR